MELFYLNLLNFLVLIKNLANENFFNKDIFIKAIFH